MLLSENLFIYFFFFWHQDSSLWAHWSMIPVLMENMLQNTRCRYRMPVLMCGISSNIMLHHNASSEFTAQVFHIICTVLQLCTLISYGRYILDCDLNGDRMHVLECSELGYICIRARAL